MRSRQHKLQSGAVAGFSCRAWHSGEGVTRGSLPHLSFVAAAAAHGNCCGACFCNARQESQKYVTPVAIRRAFCFPPPPSGGGGGAKHRRGRLVRALIAPSAASRHLPAPLCSAGEEKAW